MSKQILIIGIDGGTWTVLQPAMQAGHMPYLRQLIQQGCSGNLQSTTPPKTAAAWSTFQTGMNPGQNGVFDFSYWDRVTRKAHLVNSQSLQKTMWEYASQAERRVAVINVPMTYPPRPINGYVVSGILTPSLDSDFTWPSEFKDELLSCVPDYHILNLGNAKDGAPHTEPGAFLQHCQQIIAKRAQAALFLMEKDDFDLFMVHFQASDVVQHVMWGYMQPEHSLYSDDIRDMIFSLVYAQLDESLRQIHTKFKEKVGQECLLLVVSDHGFQTHRKRFNLGAWLMRQGQLVLRERGLLERVRHLAAMARGKAKPGKAIDWAATKAFSVGRGNDGFIYLLEDDPVARTQTADWLRQHICLIEDPESQTRIAKEVLARDQVYSGVHIERMPDLILKPADGYSFSGSHNAGPGLFQSVTPENDFHLGMHHSDGILLAHGPSVRTGATIEGARLLDIAPTVLAGLGLTIPQTMEGRPLDDLFREVFSVRTQPDVTHQQVASDADVYSEKDIENIQDRLRDLGYLE